MANQIIVNPLTKLKRVVGNREAIAVQLLDMDGEPVDVTDKTIKFRMVNNSDGTEVVAGSACTLDDDATGKVSYTPAANDVDTAGTYAIYFYDDAAIDRLWPYDGPRFLLDIVAEYGDG